MTSFGNMHIHMCIHTYVYLEQEIVHVTVQCKKLSENSKRLQILLLKYHVNAKK